MSRLEKKLLRDAGRAISDFGLIEAGDRILVGVSGGKDSFTLLHILQLLQRSAPVDFSLVACNLDQGHPGFPAEQLEAYLRSTGAEVVMLRQDTFSIVKRLEQLGGVRKMFLSHSDDVADHARFHEHFGCERILHSADDHFGAEISLDDNPRVIGRGLNVIPVPGHTRGSCALLVDDTYLFSGDHLWADGDRLGMGRGVCWYSWPEQKRSLRRLLDYRFEWVLPGHGRSLHLPAARMRAEVEALIRRT